MSSFFDSLAETTGGSVDQIKLLFCILSCYPLGSIYVRIPRTWPGVKHLFSLLLSFVILCPIMNVWSGTFQLLGITLLTYFLSATLRTPLMPWIVFATVMGHLTISHIYRAFNEVAYETFEISGPQMVLTMKLTTFAWNVFDGRRPTEELDNWQKAYRVTKFPSLLEFLGYAFYFPSVLVGPSMEYMSYASLVDSSLFASAQSGDKDRYVPRGRKRVAYTRMLTGIISLGIYVLVSGTFTYPVALNDAWLSKSLFRRIFELQIMGTVERCKYYAVWLLAEGAAILTGLGFNGYTATGGSRWDGAANVDILQIEIPSNIKTLLDGWNIKTNTWLRETIYKRVARKGKKPGFKSTMCTFVTSAFWHGFGYGYYMTFIFGGFASAVARQCRKYLRPYFIRDTNSTQPTLIKRLYDVMGTIATILAINFIAAPFFFSGLHDSLEIWRRVAWYGLWMVGLPFVFFQVFRPSHTTVEKRKEVKEQVPSPPAEHSGRDTPGLEPFTVAPVHIMRS